MKTVQVYDGDGVKAERQKRQRYPVRSWHPRSVTVIDAHGVGGKITIKAGTDDPIREQAYWLPLMESLALLEVCPADGGPFSIKGRIIGFKREARSIEVTMRIHK